MIAHPGLTSTDHFGKADTDAKWSSAWVEAFANSFWGTEAKTGAIPIMFACTAKSLAGTWDGGNFILMDSALITCHA